MRLNYIIGHLVSFLPHFSLGPNDVFLKPTFKKFQLSENSLDLDESVSTNLCKLKQFINCWANNLFKINYFEAQPMGFFRWPKIVDHVSRKSISWTEDVGFSEIQRPEEVWHQRKGLHGNFEKGNESLCDLGHKTDADILELRCSKIFQIELCDFFQN